MEEGAHTTDTEDTLGGVGAIVLPTDPPAQPATSSSKNAAGTQPSRLFNSLVSTVILRAPPFRNEKPPRAPFPHRTPVCDAPPRPRVYIAAQKIFIWPGGPFKPSLA